MHVKTDQNYFRSEKDVIVYFVSITFTPTKGGQTLLQHAMNLSLSGWENMHFACGLMDLGFV